jgi:phosphoribosylamine---glycine ligase
VCALGHTVADAQKLAYSVVSKISWKNMYCRKDIGFKAINRN